VVEAGREGRPLELTQTDRASIRNVIRKQLGALREHDPVRALACATPHRRSHGTPDHFMETIARTFPQLIHSERAEFGMLRPADDLTAQSVRVIASDGSVTHAVYLLKRQEDGTWLIDSCVCASPPGGSQAMQFPN
jgi:hypothetical protein